MKKVCAHKYNHSEFARSWICRLILSGFYVFVILRRLYSFVEFHWWLVLKNLTIRSFLSNNFGKEKKRLHNIFCLLFVQHIHCDYIWWAASWGFQICVFFFFFLMKIINIFVKYISTKARKRERFDECDCIWWVFMVQQIWDLAVDLEYHYRSWPR